MRINKQHGMEDSVNNELFRVENIEKSYGRHRVLSGASFSCRQGQCVGIVGVNGSGKSTLLSVLAGVQSADGGRVFADGVDILGDKKYIGKNIGYVPQENPLIEDLTVQDNLRLWYCDSPYNLKYELEHGFLKRLGIHEYAKKTVKKLSGGMKKRVSIAIAVHNAPKLLLLDEPSAALDLIAKKSIRDYLREYMAAGGSVVIVTHDEEELDLCDTVYVVSEGRLKMADRSLRGEKLLEAMECREEEQSV